MKHKLLCVFRSARGYCAHIAPFGINERNLKSRLFAKPIRYQLGIGRFKLVIDITEIMCSQLGIPDKYSPTTALVFIRFGERKSDHHRRKQLYTVYVTHGSGGGRKEGGKVNRLADLASIVDADIYVHGHTHLPLVFKESFFRVSGANSSVALVDKLFINTGASLDYGGYGDKAGFKPASKRSPIVYLDGHKRDMWAKL